MRVSPSIRALGLLTAAAFASAPAVAQQVTASAALSNFQYQLIDLDLTDSITPSITFDADYSANGYSIYNANPALPVPAQYLRDFGSTEIVSENGSTSATLGRTASNSRVSLTNASVDQNVTSSTQFSTRFTLSPSTGLSFSAVGAIAADSQNSQALAQVSFLAGLNYVQNGINVAQEYNEYNSTRDGARNYGVNGYFTSGQGSATGSFTLGTSAHAYSATPVPEPATYGMLLAGALVIGVAARRKRR